MVLRPLVLTALAAGLAVAVARADVVHLANGRSLRGEVVEETPGRVVVKTLDGRLTFPSEQVVRIERESRAETLLALARRAARDGDPAKAEATYARAIEEAERAGEPAVAERARAELAALPEERPEAEPGDRAPGPDQEPRWGGEGDPFALEEEEEALVRELLAAVAEHPELRPRLVRTLYERGRRRHDAGDCRKAVADFARAAAHADAEGRAALRGHEHRCRLEVASRALRRGDAALAHAAAEAVARAPADDRLGPEAWYLLGRAFEELRRDESAREAFLEGLAGTPAADEDRDLASLRELARLRSVGVPIDETTPGVGAGWRSIRTRHFAILHELEAPADLGERLEEARTEVLERLGLEVDERAGIAVFFFADRASYQASPGARRWMAGHATRLRSDRDVISAIYLYPGGNLADRIRHEVAHIITFDALDDAVLPAWGAEGVAIYAESAAARAMRHRTAVQLDRVDGLRPLDEAFGRMLTPLGDERREILTFYTQAALMFEVLADRVGVARALEALRRVNAEGPAAALREAGWTLDGFAAAVEERLASDSPGR